MSDDPVRLRDDPKRAALLRDDLRAAAAVSPALDLTAGLAKLESSLQEVAAPSGTGSTTATAAGSSAPTAGVLWIGGVLGLAGIVAAAFALTPRDDVPARPSVSGQGSRQGTWEVAPPAVQLPALTHSSTALPSPRESSDAPVAEARAHPPRRGRPAEPEKTYGTGVDLVALEIELVARARAQLADDPAAALASTERAQSESPNGSLAEEREALAILALHALGRREEASRRATDYLLRWPTGAQRARIQRVLFDEGEER